MLSRRNFLLSGAAAAADRSNKKRPNILLLMTDQQRFDSLGCYGSTVGATPNLDALARTGRVFERCYVNNPICTPSRASLLTGKSVPGHGVYRLYDNFPTGEVLFPKWLQAAGYRTALFGKLHVGSRLQEAAARHPNDGFDVYEWCLEDALHLDSPFNGYVRWLKERDPAFLASLKEQGRKLKPVPAHLHMTRWAVEGAMRFVEQADSKQPFFCMVSVFDPHDPYDRFPTEAAAMMRGRAIPTRVRETADTAAQPYGVRFEREHGYLGPFRTFTEEQMRQMRSGYYAATAFGDSELGRLLKTIEKKGIAEDTLVIFTSDHGDMLGDHDLLVKGAFFYDACVRVPLLMRWPDVVDAGTRFSGTVQPNDLAATVLAAAGCLTPEIHRRMPESRDLLAGTRESAPAICCYRNTGIFDNVEYAADPIHATMLCEGEWKLNLYHTPAPAGGQLFNLRDDPGETRDLWANAAYREVRLRLTDRLNQWMLAQELQSGSRAGESFPAPAQKQRNRLH